MKTNIAPRIQAVLLLLLVATSGVFAGVLGDRLVSGRADPPAAQPDTPTMPPMGGPWRWEARPESRYADRLGDVLDLTPAQRAAIDSIVAEEQSRVRELTEEVQPRFREIAEQTRGRIEGLLTEDQRDALRALREERSRTMRRGDMRRRPDGPGPGPRSGPDDDGAPGQRPRLRQNDTVPAAPDTTSTPRGSLPAGSSQPGLRYAAGGA
jgi:Spy/CpxP family protein refolding chaperone